MTRLRLEYGGLKPRRHSTYPRVYATDCNSSWVPANVTRLTPAMVEEHLATITGPKKLVQAWELARNPPSVFEYMLEKKMPYHKLVEKLKSI